MTTSNYITFILLGVIGLVFLIDFILNSRKKPLEKIVEKFVEEEKAKKKSWFNLKSFFWVYPISFLSFWIFLFVAFSLDGGFSGAFVDIKREFIQFDSFFDIRNDWVEFMFPLWIILFAFHYLWFLNYDYAIGNWILARKKNITLSILIISILKLMTHFYIYPNRSRRSGIEFADHLDGIFIHKLWIFAPVIIVFLIVVWFFNDKIKAR
jgi:hypothetical protein